MRFEFLQFEDFLEIKTYGDADLQGFRDIIQAFFANQDWRPGGNLLVNHRELNSAPLKTDEIREMAEITLPLQAKVGKAKIAILVARDLEYGIGRMWQSFASQGRESDSRVFKSRDEAIAWLNGSGTPL